MKRFRRLSFLSLAAYLMFSTVFSESKVYDCFMFFNEIELLKMRLEELDPVVDHFVLVESIETQRGDLKPLCFKENQQLFEKYKDKIIHIIVDERHPEMDLWERENYQRDCIARGLEHCSSLDLVIISDLDEIPRSEIITSLASLLPQETTKLLQAARGKTFKKCSKKTKRPRRDQKDFFAQATRAFEMPLYFFQLNRRMNEDESGKKAWVGTVATTYEMVQKFGVQHFRDFRWRLPRIQNGGWHFTWMGGKEKIRTKLGSVVEGTSHPEKVTDEELEAWIHTHPVVAIDESFPTYVRKNMEYLKSIGFIAAQ